MRQLLLVPYRCFSVNIMSSVTFNSLCLLWKQHTYGRKRMMNFWEENFLQDFLLDTGGIHLTSREFVSIDPCKHFTTLDREQLLTAHHLGWLLIDTESIFGIPLIRFEGKSIHRMGRKREREEEDRTTRPTVGYQWSWSPLLNSSGILFISRVKEALAKGN